MPLCQPLVCQECCQRCFRTIGGGDLGGGRWRGAIAQLSVLSRSTAFYHAVQRSIALALYNRTENENAPVHFVSILRGFCTPTLSLGVQETLWGTRLAPVDVMYMLYVCVCVSPGPPPPLPPRRTSGCCP